MSTLTLDRQDCFNIDHSFFSEYSRTGAGDDAFLALACSLGAAPDIYAERMRNGNALGLYEDPSCNPSSESYWAALGYPLAAGTPAQCDAHSFGSPLLPVESASGIQHLCGLSLLQDPLVSEEAATTDFGDNFARPSSGTLALSGSLQAQKPNARPLSKGLSGSPQSTHSRALLRHAPYNFGSDWTQSNSPTLRYQCRWSDGYVPCGAQVLATRHAIGQHLHTVHAVQLKADKTMQVCHWERCRKPMRKESIARHILEVHMQDRVLCPICGSTFARTDSMQRHQRTHSRDASDTRNATK